MAKEIVVQGERKRQFLRYRITESLGDELLEDEI